MKNINTDDEIYFSGLSLKPELRTKHKLRRRYTSPTKINALGGFSFKTGMSGET